MTFNPLFRKDISSDWSHPVVSISPSSQSGMILDASELSVFGFIEFPFWKFDTSYQEINLPRITDENPTAKSTKAAPPQQGGSNGLPLDFGVPGEG
jgi:hypothetical protein